MILRVEGGGGADCRRVDRWSLFRLQINFEHLRVARCRFFEKSMAAAMPACRRKGIALSRILVVASLVDSTTCTVYNTYSTVQNAT